MAVEISCDTARGSRYTRAMRMDAGRLLKVLALERIELSILLTSDQHIHALNHRYRHKDRPTDVLSFAQLESGEVLGVRSRRTNGKSPFPLGMKIAKPWLSSCRAGKENSRYRSRPFDRLRAGSNPLSPFPGRKGGTESENRQSQLEGGGNDKSDGAAVSGALLGDVVISIDTAVRQAQETGIGVTARLRALLVHGILHLLGYDHERSAAEATRMAARERDLLNALGSRPVLNAAR